MSRVSGPVRVALAGAALLGSLSLVAWRQGRAYDELETLERVREDIAIRTSELTELTQKIAGLEGIDRIRTEAEDRLGLRRAHENEIRLFGEEGG